MNFARLDYITATTAVDRVRALKGAGIDTVLVNWPNGTPYAYGWDGRDGYDYRPMELALDAMLKENADLRFVLSFGALHGTPYYWSVDHREELALFHCLRPMQQASLGSDRWIRDSSDAARRFAAHFAGGPHADRLAGFFPYQTAVDWHGVGETYVNIPTHEIPPLNAFPTEGDFSEPMRRAFRHWLTERYGSDEALQDAWRTTAVTLGTAEIPTRIEVRSPAPNVRDYFACYNELNARQAVAWCEALKTGAPDTRVLLPHGHVFGWPAQNTHPQGSGHNAPEILLASDAIDALVAPATLPRDQRCPLPAHPGASLRLHGKRPVQSVDLLSLREMSVEDQCAELTLAFGYAAATGSSVAVGEARDGRGSLRDGLEVYNTLPYDDDRVRAHLKLLQAWHAGRDGDTEPAAEVAVFVSPRACYLRAMDPRYQTERVEAVRNHVVNRIGLPFDEYLLSDLEAVADRYKAWIFLDCADMNETAWAHVKSAPARACFPTRAEFITRHPGTKPQTPPHLPLPLPVAEAPGPMIDALRAFAEDAGARGWCAAGDAVYAGGDVLAFCAHAAGPKTLRPPADVTKLTDVVTGESLAVKDGAVSFDSAQGEVRLFAMTR